MLSNEAIPVWLREAEDGVYGSIEALGMSIEGGQEARGWDELVAQNALQGIKIAIWLASSDFRPWAEN